MEPSKNIVPIYSHLVTQVIFISTSGIAAGVALLQTEVITTSSLSLTISFLSFAASILLGVFGLTVLLGQADSRTPDIHKGIVRWPILLSIVSFIIGVSCFTYSLSHNFFADNLADTKQAKQVTTINKDQSLSEKNIIKVIKSMNIEQQVLIKCFLEKSFPYLWHSNQTSSQKTKQLPKTGKEKQINIVAPVHSDKSGAQTK